MHLPQNLDKIRLWGAKVMWVLEIENFTTLQNLLNYEKQNAKGGQSLQMLLVKDLEVCTLALNMEGSIVANYPEIYKEKEKSAVFSPVNLRAEASHTTLNGF